MNEPELLPFQSEFARETWGRMVEVNGKLLEQNAHLRKRASTAETKLAELEKETVAFLSEGFDLAYFQQECYTPLELLNALRGRMASMAKRLAAYETANSGQRLRAESESAE